VEQLDPAIRERVHVVSIPNDDPEEGDAIVNALQRRATVVVQRSHGEGFGLAVMEAMWKRRPVVATRVGGLQEQVVDGETGLLIEPDDGEDAGEAILRLLREPETCAAMGQAGHERVAHHFLLHHDLPRWTEVIEYVVARPAEPQRV
jgi:trehalose synthase